MKPERPWVSFQPPHFASTTISSPVNLVHYRTTGEARPVILENLTNRQRPAFSGSTGQQAGAEKTFFGKRADFDLDISITRMICMSYVSVDAGGHPLDSRWTSGGQIQRTVDGVSLFSYRFDLLGACFDLGLHTRKDLDCPPEVGVGRGILSLHHEHETAEHVAIWHSPI